MLECQLVMKRLPKFLKRFFWDTDFDKLDVKKCSADIIGRILEHGDEKAVAWLEKKYTKKEIADVLFRFRFVSPKSANFWALILNLPKKRILCLQKRYLKTQRKHWPY